MALGLAFVGWQLVTHRKQRPVSVAIHPIVVIHPTTGVQSVDYSHNYWIEVPWAPLVIVSNRVVVAINEAKIQGERGNRVEIITFPNIPQTAAQNQVVSLASR
jgi:hypothetical protein